MNCRTAASGIDRAAVRVHGVKVQWGIKVQRSRDQSSRWRSWFKVERSMFENAIPVSTMHMSSAKRLPPFGALQRSRDPVSSQREVLRTKEKLEAKER